MRCQSFVQHPFSYGVDPLWWCFLVCLLQFCACAHILHSIVDFLMWLVCFWFLLWSGVPESFIRWILLHYHVYIWLVWGIVPASNWQTDQLHAHWSCLLTLGWCTSELWTPRWFHLLWRSMVQLHLLQRFPMEIKRQLLEVSGRSFCCFLCFFDISSDIVVLWKCTTAVSCWHGSTLTVWCNLCCPQCPGTRWYHFSNCGNNVLRITIFHGSILFGDWAWMTSYPSCVSSWRKLKGSVRILRWSARSVAWWFTILLMVIQFSITSKGGIDPHKTLHHLWIWQDVLWVS